jgi:hypothetical protein
MKHFVVLFDEWKRDYNGDWDNPPGEACFSTKEAAESWIAKQGRKISNVWIRERQGEIPEYY